MVLLLAYMTVGIYIITMFAEYATIFRVAAMKVLVFGIIFFGATSILNKVYPAKLSFVLSVISDIMLLTALVMSIIGESVDPNTHYFNVNPEIYISLAFALLVCMQTFYRFLGRASNPLTKIKINFICAGIALAGIAVAIFYLASSPPAINKPADISLNGLLSHTLSLPLLFVMISALVFSISALIEDFPGMEAGKYIKLSVPVAVFATCLVSVIMTAPDIAPIDSVYVYPSAVFFSARGVFRLWLIIPILLSVSTVLNDGFTKKAINLGTALITIAFAIVIIALAIDATKVNSLTSYNEDINLPLVVRYCVIASLLGMGIWYIVEFGTALFGKLKKKVTI